MLTKKELERVSDVRITWTDDGKCPFCDCCSQVLCLEAYLGGTVTCAYVADDYGSKTSEAGEAALGCPCTPARLAELRLDAALQDALEAGLPPGSARGLTREA